MTQKKLLALIKKHGDLELVATGAFGNRYRLLRRGRLIHFLTEHHMWMVSCYEKDLNNFRHRKPNITNSVCRMFRYDERIGQRIVTIFNASTGTLLWEYK